MRTLVLIMSIFLWTSVSEASHDHKDFIDVVEQTRKAIVVVSVKQNDTIVISSNPLEKYLNPEEEKKEKKENPFDGFGTGFVVQGKHIITNNHVIDNNKRVIITFEHDPVMYEANVIATDPMTDIAVLELVNPSRLDDITPLKWSAHKVVPGQDVWAIGHPLGMSYTVSKGIVSHTKRRVNNGWQGFIQTDVSINRGNSGGPLLNMEGEVIGVNTLIMSPGSGGSIGISMSIDSHVATRIIEKLIKDGEVRRPIMGTVLNYSQELLRVTIEKVQEGSPAELAGVIAGDVVIEMDGNNIESISEIFDILQTKDPHDTLDIMFLRGDETVNIKLILGELTKEDISLQLKELQPKE